MGKTKQKINSPKSVGLEVLVKKPNKPLIYSSYKPLPRFGAGCTNCR